MLGYYFLGDGPPAQGYPQGCPAGMQPMNFGGDLPICMSASDQMAFYQDIIPGGPNSPAMPWLNTQQGGGFSIPATIGGIGIGTIALIILAFVLLKK